jgi:hypothetical protein
LQRAKKPIAASLSSIAGNLHVALTPEPAEYVGKTAD